MLEKNMSDLWKVGDYCRLLQGTPARYIGAGVGLGVCSRDNELLVGLACSGAPSELPLPTDQEVRQAADVAKVVMTSHTAALRVAVNALEKLLKDTFSPNNEPPELLAMRIATRALDSIKATPLLERNEKLEALALKFVRVGPDDHGDAMDQLGNALARITREKKQLHQMLGRALHLIEVEGVMDKEGYKEAKALLEATRD